jgi:hypothetical protein
LYIVEKEFGDRVARKLVAGLAESPVIVCFGVFWLQPDAGAFLARSDFMSL